MHAQVRPHVVTIHGYLVCSGSYSVHPTVIGGATRAYNNSTCCTSDMCCSEQITASQLVWYVYYYILTSSVLNF